MEVVKPQNTLGHISRHAAGNFFINDLIRCIVIIGIDERQKSGNTTIYRLHCSQNTIDNRIAIVYRLLSPIHEQRCWPSLGIGSRSKFKQMLSIGPVVRSIAPGKSITGGIGLNIAILVCTGGDNVHTVNRTITVVIIK